MSASTVEQALGPEPKLEQELQDAPASSAVASADTASTEGASVGGEMPPGLTKMQQVAWKNREKL
eukprot:COSAG02_NODE_31818_length_526_cov_170.515222_2_plen_64_part_01